MPGRGVIKSHRSTQPSIPPGQVKGISASLAGVKAGCVRLCLVASNTVWLIWALSLPCAQFNVCGSTQRPVAREFDWFDRTPPPTHTHTLSHQQYMHTVTVVVLAVNCLTFLLKYNGICTKMSQFSSEKVPKFSSQTLPPLGRGCVPLPTYTSPLGAYRGSIKPPPSGMSGYGPVLKTCED